MSDVKLNHEVIAIGSIGELINSGYAITSTPILLGEYQIDEAIEQVKEINAEIERFEEIHRQRIEKLDWELERKIESLEKSKSHLISQIRYSVMDSEDKKETKTQYKKTFLSGDVVVKKPRTKMIKPKINQEEIDSRLHEYVKEKVSFDINWKDLSSKLVFDKGKVINTETGEDFTDLVEIEQVEEEIQIK